MSLHSNWDKQTNNILLRRFLEILAFVVEAVVFYHENDEVQLKQENKKYEVLCQIASTLNMEIEKMCTLPILDTFFLLYQDQDDELISMMSKLLNIYEAFQMEKINPHYLNQPSLLLVTSKILPSVHPHLIFHRFVRVLGYDHSVLLDFLISTETCFLEYFTNYLKFVTLNFEMFVELLEGLEENQMNELEYELRGFQMETETEMETILKKETELDIVMSTLIRLKLSIERLVEKNLFPYNIQPLLLKIQKLEQFYEQDNEHVIHQHDQISLVNY